MSPQDGSFTASQSPTAGSAESTKARGRDASGHGPISKSTYDLLYQLEAAAGDLLSATTAARRFSSQDKNLEQIHAAALQVAQAVEHLPTAWGKPADGHHAPARQTVAAATMTPEESLASPAGAQLGRPYQVFWISGARQSQPQTESLTCVDDTAAVAQASRLRNGRAAEIWDQHRLAALISGDGTVSRVPDKLVPANERAFGIPALVLIAIFLAMPLVVIGLMTAL